MKKTCYTMSKSSQVDCLIIKTHLLGPEGRFENGGRNERLCFSIYEDI